LIAKTTSDTAWIPAAGIRAVRCGLIDQYRLTPFLPKMDRYLTCLHYSKIDPDCFFFLSFFSQWIYISRKKRQIRECPLLAKKGENNGFETLLSPIPLDTPWKRNLFSIIWRVSLFKIQYFLRTQRVNFWSPPTHPFCVLQKRRKSSIWPFSASFAKYWVRRKWWITGSSKK